MNDTIEHLKSVIRDVPDFPQPGIVFKDITPLLADANAFSSVIDLIVVHYGRGNIDKVAGIEARGFILASPVAYHFGAGFVPVRKAGKLPWESEAEEYSLEYGVDTIEIHADAIHKGSRVLLVDDLIATGGTAAAATELIRRSGGELIAAAFVIDLPDLGGAQRLARHDVKVHTLVSFEGH